MANPKTTGWDTSYEWKVVTLLGLGFGLVGLDRWIIGPLFPTIAKDLGLNYQDIGNIAAVLGIVWGVFAGVSGRLSDFVGHRKVLIPALLVFSLMSGLSGMATGLVSLVVIRGLMGLAEGSFCPTSFVATASAAHPSRRGFLQGLQQSGFALFGFGLAPIIATQLLLVTTWNMIFWVVAIPGFIIATLLYFVLREPAQTQGGAAVGAVRSAEVGGSDYVTIFGNRYIMWYMMLFTFGMAGIFLLWVFVPSTQAALQPVVIWGFGIFVIAALYGAFVGNRNIMLGTLALMCAMTCIFVLGALLPSYLTDYVKITTQQMGFVTSAMGFGGFVGQFGVPGVSDILGRKLTAILTFVGATVSIYLFSTIGANPTMLFASLFLVSLFALGSVALITGPISTESAPAGSIAAAIGVVVASGEIFGGGIAPSIAGFVAQNYGIQNILYLPMIGAVVGIVVCLFLKETAPRKVGGVVAAPVH